MKYALMALTILLTGCTSTGAPLLLAKLYNNADDCQRTELIEQGKYPRYCGASSGRNYIYATPHARPLGAQVGYTSK